MKTENVIIIAGLALLLHRRNTKAAIGKFYDDDKIKPGSRVDQYWGNIKIDPKKYGVEDRKGLQFTSVSDAITHFDLYSIEFGNWLNQEERLGFMYASLVTLRDMAEVVGVRQDQMGLKRTLSLAFGSRGRGGKAAAFFQPRYNVINLTKTHGYGTLCHEYVHAVDYYFKGQSGWRSMRKQPDYTGKPKDSIAWLFENVIDGVLWNDDGTISSYHRWLDKQSDYFNRRSEIFARIGEVFFMNGFKAKGIKNTWGIDGDRMDLPEKKLVGKVSGSLRKIFKKI